MNVNTLNALDTKRFPSAYGEYFALEEALVRRNAKGTVLDVGCGTGRIISALDGVCLSYTGIDRDQALLSKARLETKKVHFQINFVACEDRKSVV